MLKIYNTLSRKKEVFKPLRKKEVGLYACGPTVYGASHIGHAKTYIAFDIIRRYLEYKNYKVKYVMNITDVHDDVIKEATKQKRYFLSLADKYAKIFLKEQIALGIKTANNYPRVTKHIPNIIKFIQKLIKKGYAYEEKGSIYFDVSKFKDYGKLSRIKLKKAITSTRVKTDKYKRDEAADFALWKRVLPKTRSSWSSPWGLGRPGWHIECSVMSQKYLGKCFDIHGGAKDLIFPHHENEIAQSEAVTGQKPFVKYWLHSGLITINGQKMSRSLNNYIEINQVLKKWPTRVIRFFVTSAHYRSLVDYNKKTLLQSKKNLERIDEFITKLKSPAPSSSKFKTTTKNLKLLEFKKSFEKAMDDDFNTPKAIAVIFKLISKGNSLMDQNLLTKADSREVLSFFKKIDKIFNFIFWPKQKEKIPNEVLELVQERERNRQKGDWRKADKIRAKIKKMGYLVEDTKKGPKAKKF